MDNLKFPVMDSLKLQLYGNVPESQQQARHLGSQARALEQEIGNPFVKLMCQRSPKLTPELIGIIRYLTDEIGKISQKLNGWEAVQLEEHHLRELKGFPTMGFKEFWKHLGEEETYPPRTQATKEPTFQESTYQGLDGPSPNHKKATTEPPSPPEVNPAPNQSSTVS